jgi:hypothetical protein
MDPMNGALEVRSEKLFMLIWETEVVDEFEESSSLGGQDEIYVSYWWRSELYAIPPTTCSLF